MKNIKKSNILPKVPDAATVFKHPLFLDIETTGFSASRNRLYLIGAAYIQNGSLVLEQFFAETPQEEPQLLHSLDRLLERADTVITFHGNHFDLPFLDKRRERLEMAPVSHNRKQIDLYELARSWRHIFGLQNYRQKTLEAFLGIERKDAYSGGELIRVYQSYMRQPREELSELLLQHNEEDILGMTKLLSLSAYDTFFNGRFIPADCQPASYPKLDGSDGKELTVTCRLDECLPASVSCNNEHFYLHAAKDRACFRIAMTEGTLKYFYPNYKDYYYLPDEDMAMHKSVAFYVDPAHRQKAKAANCYSKKTGVFLPQYEEVIAPALYTDYKASVSYFEWKEAFAKDHTLLKQYCMHILQVLKDGK